MPAASNVVTPITSRSHSLADAPRRSIFRPFPVPQTARQWFYLAVLQGVGAGIIDGGANFSIAYAMYGKQSVVKMWVFKDNTIAGDLGVTPIIQCLASMLITSTLVHTDLHHHAIQPLPFVYPHVEHLPDPRTLSRSRSSVASDMEKGEAQVPRRGIAYYYWMLVRFIFEGTEKNMMLARVGVANWFGRLLWTAAQGAAIGVIFGFPIWCLAIVILGPIYGNTNMGGKWAPQVIKLVYGAIVGWVTNPVIATLALGSQAEHHLVLVEEASAENVDVAEGVSIIQEEDEEDMLAPPIHTFGTSIIMSERADWGESNQAGPSTLAYSPEHVALSSDAEDDIGLLIASYLSAHRPDVARVVEAALAPLLGDEHRAAVGAVERALLAGDFAGAERGLACPGLLGAQTQKAFAYLCWKQHYLELVNARKTQAAFELLQHRLKPLEHYQPVPYDFYTLSYLLSASTVHDSPGLRHWEGAGPEREKLVARWRELMDGRRRGRLVTLLRQAAAWQVQNSRHRSSGPWTVTSLLHDYYLPVAPGRLERLVVGHSASIKCVAWVNDELAVSGSSDSTLRVFSPDTGKTRAVLMGQGSRIWDVDVSDTGAIASGSGDGCMRVWNIDGACRTKLQGDGGDMYGVRWRPGRSNEVATASFDKMLRLWDVEAGRETQTFSGHAQSTQCVAFDPAGSVLASGSKDKHIRLWDAVGGVCVHIMPAQLGEITSVELCAEGRYLLAACKDDSNRLWDLRMQRNVYRYVGHQNTSRNLVRCTFASGSSSLIASGSEDGCVHLWDREAGAGAGSAAEALSTVLPGAGRDGQSALVSPALSASSVLSPSHLASFSLADPPNDLLVPLVPLPPPAQRPLPRAPERVSPAYYPPREARAHAHRTTATTIRPAKVLSGHGCGPVYDVRARAGRLVSGGEDGLVGVWGPDVDGT
ncbi:hypothetical protein Q5752_001609 [Cryptotrichosporon argae]